MNDIEFLDELERRADKGNTVPLTEEEYKQMSDIRGYGSIYLPGFSASTSATA